MIYEVAERWGGASGICLSTYTTRRLSPATLIKVSVSTPRLYHPPAPLVLALVFGLKNKVKPKTECDMRSCQAQPGSTTEGGEGVKAVWNHRVTE